MASQDFNDQLNDLTLDNVVLLDDELGCGAYGSVFKAYHLGLPCAAKKVHRILLYHINPEEQKATKDNFLRECYYCSLINHPNIVQFKGIYYDDADSYLPIMVMELMDTSLTLFINNNQSNVTDEIKLSILHDVSLGLSHLHGRNPAIIHRDLSSNNVLLTTNLNAKIIDLGVAKMIRADGKQTKSKLTTCPGCLHFMPPEALVEDPVYVTPVDVFSFAIVSLHLFSEEWPNPKYQVENDPITKKLVALTEAERRQHYLDKISTGMSVLRKMIENCLENDPDIRPSIHNVVNIIEYEQLQVC